MCQSITASCVNRQTSRLFLLVIFVGAFLYLDAIHEDWSYAEHFLPQDRDHLQNNEYERKRNMSAAM
jgi:hypothetical protein